MGGRGTYRSIRASMLDEPAFQELSERANHVLLVAKISFGPSGIEIHYAEALVHVLAARSCIPVEGVRLALEELQAKGRLRAEGNVVWVLDQLNHDPHLDAADKKHRTSIQRHVAALPRLGIIRDFIDAHPEWFASAEEDPYQGLPRASTGPLEGPGRPIEAPNTDNRITKTEKGEPNTRERAREFSTEDEGIEVEVLGGDGSDAIHSSQRMSGSQVLHAWETRIGQRVASSDRRRHASIARKIADGHSAQDIVLAFLGIGQLFPHSNGEPWDLFDLDRKFTKAVAKARDHPELRAAQREAELMDLLGGAT